MKGEIIMEMTFKEKNAEQLIREFFKELKHTNIIIRDKDEKIEIIFKDSTVEVLNTIIELIKDKEPENNERTEQSNLESESIKQTEQQVKAGSENSERAEQKNLGSENSKQNKSPKKKGRQIKKVDIPELEEIAKKASSYEHFVKLVAEWLEMDKLQGLFENIEIASTEVDTLSWKELERKLKEKGIVYRQNDKIRISNQISIKLKKKYSVTAIPLLDAIRQYKNYSFGDVAKQPEGGKITEQQIEEASRKAEINSEETNESTVSEARIKMACMPEIKEFEERLASVDKTQPVEERIRYIFELMELNKKSDEQQSWIIKIASIAVRSKNMSFAILKEEMMLSKFINDYVGKYEPDKKVKSKDFLEELQSIIMFENEIV